MKKKCALFFILFITISISISRSDLGLDRYPWLTDLEKAQRTAVLEKKPLLIIFRCEP